MGWNERAQARMAGGLSGASPGLVVSDDDFAFVVRGKIRGVAIVARTEDYFPAFGKTPEEFLSEDSIRIIAREDGGGSVPMTAARVKAVLAALAPAVERRWEEKAQPRDRAARERHLFTRRGQGLSGGGAVRPFAPKGEAAWPSDYTHFVVQDGDVESGWEYKEDAQDRANEIRESWGFKPRDSRVKVLTRTGVNRGGHNWGTP